MGSRSAVACERVGDFRRDMSCAGQSFEALGIDRPEFGGCEGLPENGKVGEGGHDGSAGGLVLIADDVVEEFAFQVMHPGCCDRGAMESAPKSDGSHAFEWSKWFVEEIDVFLASSQVDIDEKDDPGMWVFEDLRAPSGFGSRVEAFTALESHGNETLQEWLEGLPGAAVGVVVVVGPADAELVLSAFLPLCGGIPCRVEIAFGFEECFDRRSDAHGLGSVVEQGIDLRDAIHFVVVSGTVVQRMSELQSDFFVGGGCIDGSEFVCSAPFDGHQFAEWKCDMSAAVRASRCSVYCFDGEGVVVAEVLDGFYGDGERGGVSFLDADGRKSGLVGFPDMVSGIADLVLQPQRFEELRFHATIGQDPVVDRGGEIDSDCGETSAQVGYFGVVLREVGKQGSEEKVCGGKPGPGVGDLMVACCLPGHGVVVPQGRGVHLPCLGGALR